MNRLKDWLQRGSGSAFWAAVLALFVMFLGTLLFLALVAVALWQAVR